MPLILRPLARTTPHPSRASGRRPHLSDARLARRYGVTAPTVRKWRGRESTADRSHRPDMLHCTLTAAQEAVAMAIQRTLWLPLDDLLVVVREFLNPAVSRSGLARCMKRHGVNRHPAADKDATIAHKAFKDYAPGFVHVDIKYLPQMADETARRYLFVAIDRAMRWVYVRIYADRSDTSSTDFVRRLPAEYPCFQMYYGPEYISGAPLAWAEREGIRIEHIQPGKPQQNAYIERYNRTVRYGWLARTLFDTIEQVQDKATRWLWTYNHERPNMTHGGITPMQKLTLVA